MISAIFAMDKNKGIGKDNKLPWNLPNDLKYFKNKTINNVVVMGRKTYESIGRPLPKRDNIVVSRDQKFCAAGTNTNYSTITIRSVEELDKVVGKDEDVFIIGGAQIFNEFINKVEKLYLTYIDEEFDCDTFLDVFDEKDWILESESKGEKDENNPYNYYFKVYKRK